jgi:hypothetical protein
MEGGNEMRREIQDENALASQARTRPPRRRDELAALLGRTLDFYLPNPHLRSALLRAIPPADDNFFEKLILSAAAKLCEKKREENSEHITERGERNQRVLIGLSIKHKK